MFSGKVDAANYYWTTVDKTLDGIYLNFRVIQTETETAPTTTDFGKKIQVSSGPYTSKGEARSSCFDTIKLARKSGQLVKNFCESVTKGK